MLPQAPACAKSSTGQSLTEQTLSLSRGLPRRRPVPSPKRRLWWPLDHRGVDSATSGSSRARRCRNSTGHELLDSVQIPVPKASGNTRQPPRRKPHCKMGVVSRLGGRNWRPRRGNSGVLAYNSASFRPRCRSSDAPRRTSASASGPTGRTTQNPPSRLEREVLNLVSKRGSALSGDTQRLCRDLPGLLVAQTVNSLDIVFPSHLFHLDLRSKRRFKENQRTGIRVR